MVNVILAGLPEMSLDRPFVRELAFKSAVTTAPSLRLVYVHVSVNVTSSFGVSEASVNANGLAGRHDRVPLLALVLAARVPDSTVAAAPKFLIDAEYTVVPDTIPAVGVPVGLLV